MASIQKLDYFGLSQSELATYLSNLKFHPANGSRLSRHSGVPRANIYDVLRSLCQKGYVVEVEEGLYAPLPPEEFIKRLRHKCDTELDSLKEKIEATSRTTSYDYVWAIYGWEEVMNKAVEMIASAEFELYVLAYPKEGAELDAHLVKAEQRGVEVKYVSMGPPTTEFEYQIIHPETENIYKLHQGRVFDLVKDKNELLVGMFQPGAEDESRISWAKNHWFIQAIREGIRHGFFHYFLHNILELGRDLSEKERRIYQRIKNDTWAAQ